jgi:hypothetical protein
MPVKVGGLVFGVLCPELSLIARNFSEMPESSNTWLRVIGHLFKFPVTQQWIPNFGLLSLGLMALVPAGLLASAKRKGWAIFILCALALPMLLVCISPGFKMLRLSGWNAANSRFLYATFFPMVVVAFRGISTKWPSSADPVLLAAASLYVVGVWYHWSLWEAPWVVGLAALTVLGVWACYRSRRVLSGRFHLATVVVAVVGVLTVLATARSLTHQHALINSHFFHDIPTYWVEAAEALDTPPRTRIIAVSSGFSTWRPCFYFMFMGRNLQNRILYIPITETGEIRPLVGDEDLLRKDASYTQWLKRLQAKRITDVVSFPPRSTELQWMRDHPESFQLMFVSQDFGCFAVRDHVHESGSLP